MLTKRAFLVTLFLLSAAFLFAQDKSSEIYETIMASYGHKFNVIKTSSKRTLNQAYFQDPLKMELYVRDTLNNEWMTFLKGIDTANVQIGPIDPAFLKKHSGITKGYVDNVIFSPVIFSPSTKMAVCGVYKFRRDDGHSEAIFLVEKRKRKWTVRKVFFISIS